jgi:general secretion pathway protein H
LVQMVPPVAKAQIKTSVLKIKIKAFICQLYFTKGQNQKRSLPVTMRTGLQRKTQRRQHGFTLLELLVVIVIVSILFTYTTLAIRSNSPEDLIKEEAFRLEYLIQLAMEESILRGEEYGIEVYVDGYRFLRLGEGQWQPLTADKILHERELANEIELEMHMEESKIFIDNVLDPLADEEADLDDMPEDEKKAIAKPHIYLLSSGEIDPEFEIRFYMLGVETSYIVKGLFDGTLKAEVSDL